MNIPSDIVVGAPLSGVVTITIARPEVRNALRHRTMIEIADALETADRDETVRCVVICGNARAFAAGADINEMIELDGASLRMHPRTLAWQRIWRVECPIVAAVEGVALGGGCELVLSCDITIAGASARFGQPEISLGWMPGAGGTQRLARVAGKSITMQMVLTGDMIDATAACNAGIVSEVMPAGDALVRATTIAERIASQPRDAVRTLKRIVLRAYETPLSEGIREEHGAFRALTDSEERTQRMRAFLDRPSPARSV